MTSLAPETGAPTQNETDEAEWGKRITNALEYRRAQEPVWLQSLAYVAQEQWAVVTGTGRSRTLQDISEVDERYADVDLVIADLILERRGAALGELEAESARPEFLSPGDADLDPEEESVQAQVNRALGHAWDFEADADRVISDGYQKCVDLGVSAIRVRYDKTAGKPKVSSDGQQVQAPIGPDGHPITDAAQAHEYVSGLVQQGQPPAQFTPLNEGRITLEAGSAFNVLVPPGIPHEKDFPWEVWVRPALLDEVQGMYPAAKDLTADNDIGSIVGTTLSGRATGTAPMLKDHVWLFTGYERPTRKHPKGRVAVLAGTQKMLLETRDELPYQTVDGCWESGVVYLHWWRLTDRFFSLGLVDTLKESQRLTNRTATQSQELIDRSMPFGIVSEKTLPQKPNGMPMEWVEVKDGALPPQWIQGPGPGPWLEQHRDRLIQDADRASTISALKLGENPANVNTYSQLARLDEHEAGKRSSIRVGIQRANTKIAELMLLDITKYWPESKQIMVAGGASDELQAHEFSKHIIPPMYVVRPATGSAKPRSQSAQLQLIEQIWNGAVASGAVQQSPTGWIEWYKSSLEAGDMLPIPEPPTDNQVEKAERENHALLVGEQPAVAYWDQLQVHLGIHRRAQDEAILAGDVEALHRIEQHVEEHQQVAAQVQAQIQAQMPPQPMAAQAAQPQMQPGPPQPQGPPQQAAPPGQ